MTNPNPNPTPYPTGYSPITDGEAVNETVTNRPLDQLQQRTTALLETVQNALIGTTTMDRDVPVSADAKVGSPVYLDNSGTYQRGLASTTVNGTILVVDNSAYVWGVVQKKHSSTLANVVYNGYMCIREDELEAIMDSGTATTGTLFLSATNSGQLTETSPPIGIPVCRVAGPIGTDTDGENLYSVYVNPGWKNPFEQHTHYHIQMTVTDGVDTVTEGWTDDAGVLATGPAGSRFRYNHTLDSDLDDVFPPIPTEAVHIDRDGVAADTYSGGDIVVNTDGIWWIDTVNDPSSYSRLDFYFTRMTFQTDLALVTSLVADDNTISITNTSGAAASRGDLKIKANVAFTSGSNSSTNDEAVKSANGLSLLTGPVVVGVGTDTSTYVTISGGTALDAPNADYKKGLLKVNVQDPSGQRVGPVEFVELDNVELEKSNGIHYLEFNPSVDGIITGRIQVPEVGVSGSLNLVLKFLVWAFAAGTMPDLEMSYLKITPSGTLGAIPTSFTALTDLNVSGLGAATAGQGAVVTSSTISVDPGDIVLFTLRREGVDAYAGKVGIIDQWWRVDPV